jgi:hypothetical protein
VNIFETVLPKRFHESFFVHRSAALPQPYARAIPVLSDEYNASGFAGNEITVENPL